MFIVLGIYNFGQHSHSNSLARNGTRCITLGRLHFSCWCMCSMFVFKRFFFFGENLQGSKKIHSGLLRFPSSLPCSQGGPTFYMQKLHSNLKHLIPIHTFKKIFFFPPPAGIFFFSISLSIFCGWFNRKFASRNWLADVHSRASYLALIRCVTLLQRHRSQTCF